MKSDPGAFVRNNFSTILGLLMLLMIASRLGYTYVSGSGFLSAPEAYFGVNSLGRDLVDYGVLPWGAIQRGESPIIFGYGTVLASGIGVGLLSLAGICRPGALDMCGTYIYICMLALSLVGFLVLLFSLVKQKEDRMLALTLLSTFLLGIPASKAFVAGNPDIFLSVILGVILLFVRRRFKQSTYSKQSLTLSIVLGLLLGYFLNVKAFLLPLVLATLLVSGRNLSLWISFIVGFTACSLWPELYGVKSHILSVFQFAAASSTSEASSILARVHYGNISIVPYVSNILYAAAGGKLSPGTHTMVTVAGSVILVAGVFVKPFIDERIAIHPRMHIRASFPLFLLLVTLSYLIMLTSTAWAYDYRIFYALPILFAFLGEKRTVQTTSLLYFAIFFLLTKSLFIPKDRLMTVFLYIHFYFLLRTALSHWKNEILVKTRGKIEPKHV